MLRNSKCVTTLDITGGAPEMNKEFRYLVTEVRATRHSSSAVVRIYLCIPCLIGRRDNISAFPLSCV